MVKMDEIPKYQREMNPYPVGSVVQAQGIIWIMRYNGRWGRVNIAPPVKRRNQTW